MYTYGVKVDIGVFEKQNDDRALVSTTLITEGISSGYIQNEFVIASICDGVGGMAQGYRAAMTTLDIMKHLDRTGVEIENIKTAIEEANRRVRIIQKTESLMDGLRTTIAGIYTNEEKFYVFNVGDSRIYRFRYKYLQQLSKDHSFVQDLIDLGELSNDDAKNHPQKNVINKCIGHEEKVIPRIVDMSNDLVRGDIILICSDGLTDVMTDMEIKKVINNYKDKEELAECCEELVEKAKSEGSLDNISVIMLRKE